MTSSHFFRFSRRLPKILCIFAAIIQFKRMKRFELNLRDLGGITFEGGAVPHGLYLRSGKLSILTKEECAELSVWSSYKSQF